LFIFQLPAINGLRDISHTSSIFIYMGYYIISKQINKGYPQFFIKS